MAADRIVHTFPRCDFATMRLVAIPVSHAGAFVGTLYRITRDGGHSTGVRLAEFTSEQLIELRDAIDTELREAAR